MTTDHITAMKQALEALEFSTKLNTHHRLMTGEELRQACTAITSLRAALAQQQAEPVAWIDGAGHPHHISAVQTITERRLYGPWRPLYTAPPAPAAAPKEGGA